MLKSEVNNLSEKKELPFPKLMINRDGDIIILAIGKTDATTMRGVVVGGGYCADGCYDTTFLVNRFADFYGSITLTQTSE